MVVLAAVAVGIFVLPNAFTQDDIAIIADSTRLHGFSAWRDVFTLPYWPPPASPDLYRPILSLLLAGEFAIGGGIPVLFRIVSVIIYAAAAVGVLALNRALVPTMAALMAALWFAFHPLHVEALTLGVAQNELIVGTIAAAASLMYIRDRRSHHGGIRPVTFVTVALAYPVAALSKENGFVLPLLLAACEVVVPAPSLRARVRASWPLFTVLAVVGGLAFAARTAVLHGAVAASFSADALADAGVGTRILTLFRMVPEWVRLFVFPWHLRAEYSPQEFVAARTLGGRELLGVSCSPLHSRSQSRPDVERRSSVSASPGLPSDCCR